jgi:hypothetical protein
MQCRLMVVGIVDVWFSRYEYTCFGPLCHENVITPSICQQDNTRFTTLHVTATIPGTKFRS